jgi:hypothetical protein
MERSYEITPEPTEEERAAIVEALAAEESGRRRVSEWADALLPVRGEWEDEP